MQYFITFLEGIISFISPCMLPMLPIYISYFGGNQSKTTIAKTEESTAPDLPSTSTKEKSETGNSFSVISRVLAFVLGFTLIFVILGLGAGSIGAILIKHNRAVNIICGLIIIIFGLSYLGLFSLPFFKGMGKAKNVTSFFSAFVFGMIYSVSLTPCVGAFLGSALMMASSSASAAKGVLLLLCYSAGLGIPFIISALILDRLKGAFNFIKQHYKIINLICGGFLILTGILMITGILGKLLALFN